MGADLQREWELEDEAKGRMVDPLSHEGDIAGTVAYVRALEGQTSQARRLVMKALDGRWVRFKKGKYAGYVGQIEWVRIAPDGAFEITAHPRSLRDPAEKLWLHRDARRSWLFDELELLPRSFTGEDVSRKPATR
jgi:hypothetical protein